MTNYNKKTIKDIISLHNAGEAPAIISQKLNLPINDIKNICEDYDISEDIAKIDPSQVEYIIRSYLALSRKLSLMTGHIVIGLEFKNGCIHTDGLNTPGAEPMLLTYNISPEELLNFQVNKS